MVSQKELLERALKGLSGLTHQPEQKPSEPARIRPMTEAALSPDVAEAIAAYRQVFDVKAVRVVGPDKERGIPYKRWRVDQITLQSEEYLNNPPPLQIELTPIRKNAKPPKPCIGALASLRPDGGLKQLSIDFRPQGTGCGDVEPDCPASQDHEGSDPSGSIGPGVS
jgi:hypothetical protein